MTALHDAAYAVLPERALVRLAGPDWRSFLQGLITQDVMTMAEGEMRYAALLTPQGRLLYDLFIVAQDAGALLDTPAAAREALISRLRMYRLRAKVEIEPAPGAVAVRFGGAVAEDAEWRRDPRLPALGLRGLGPVDAAGAATDAAAYDLHRLALGVPDIFRDGLSDKAYALEANFDLLNAIDFRKGCFVGQEITSRMKRRSVVKTRIAPLQFEGPALSPGAEVLNGSLRAGEVRSGAPGRALALLRLDRAVEGRLTVEGREVELDLPNWLEGAVQEVAGAPAG